MWYYNFVMISGGTFVALVLLFITGWLLFAILKDIRTSYLASDMKSVRNKSIGYGLAIMSIIVVIILKASKVIPWEISWLW